MEKELKHIELFAGCGGMSLGLESAGFDLFFANELSPMAGETFSYNINDESLLDNKLPKKTLWIKSQFKDNKLNNRLRENPNEARDGLYSDLDKATDLYGKLLIGDVNQLLNFLIDNPSFTEKIRRNEIDLLSGGPPCQSFSLAGKREKDNFKNTLPLSFAKIAGLLQPKTILLENVKGIVSPFSSNGEKYYAWLEVSKAFALEGYVPVCMMLNSKYFGVAQNRPRFILIAYREDIFNTIHDANESKCIQLKNSQDFYNKTKKYADQLNLITKDDLNLYDLEANPDLFDGNILPKITHFERDFIASSEAIGDIRRTKISYKVDQTKGKYANYLNEVFPSEKKGVSEIQNHEPRRHNFQTKSRFRFYQVIEQFQNGLKKGAIDLFTGKKVEFDLRMRLLGEFSNYSLLFKDPKTSREIFMIPENIREVEELVKSIPTKKHSQRALKEFEPAPAQLTIPDDLCHYDSEQPRTLTVREMARFQSFPDWFVFKSKVTTGGRMRSFEVPQYTQVGNAVPPLLARALGMALKKQLLHIKNG
ncbi:DNA cytosine methyltransferase [Marinifilum flexuosum]|uniref:DNA cytosine methyltransferase n=1 Tax=Marinifilum flexuosum TaxID=1117708 RepID=UPI00248FEC13|nr:DNA cytosine methyltransferase [Marinifilum flexuosum]